MHLDLYIPTKPISLNHYYQNNRDGGVYKPKKSKDWDREMIIYLNPYKKEIYDFADMFDPKTHYLEAEYTFFKTEQDFFTKDYRIKKTSGDRDNFIKPVQDHLFKMLKKIDDSSVIDGFVRVLPAEKAAIKIRLHINHMNAHPILSHFRLA